MTQLDLLKSERDDLRSDRNRWRIQATALLEDKRDKQAGEQTGVTVRAWRHFFKR